MNEFFSFVCHLKMFELLFDFEAAIENPCGVNEFLCRLFYRKSKRTTHKAAEKRNVKRKRNAHTYKPISKRFRLLQFNNKPIQAPR